MPRETPHQETLIEAVKNLPLTAELFDEQNGKQKYASDLEVILRGRDYGNRRPSSAARCIALLIRTTTRNLRRTEAS